MQREREYRRHRVRNRSPDDFEKPNILRDQEAYGESTHVKSEGLIEYKAEYGEHVVQRLNWIRSDV